MQASSIPALIPIPFASAGAKNTIPVASQISITPGAASYTDGFPALTRTPLIAGGIAPAGQDMNGILNAITTAILWSQAGGGYYYDSTFGPAISGYPLGAELHSSDNAGFWINQTDTNATAPESTTTTPTGWVPGYQYGVTAITGLAATSITLTPLQAAKRRITLAGTLTANINIIFPAWTKDWTVVNNCTGAFTVTCKTAAGNGITIASGKTAQIVCDGTNITTDALQNVLLASNNLSDLTSIPAALAYLGLGGFVQDTGTANAVVIASPVILADGVPFLVKFAATNTANVTIKVGNYPANPLVGIAGALNGGEIAAGGYGWVVYSSTLAGFVLISPVYGGALQVGTALQPKHAVQLAQVLPVAKISNFSAAGVNQTISVGVDTALIPATEAFDDLNEYSTSTGKFTATSAGTYVFSATVHGTTTTTGRRILMIFINGVEQYRLQENAQMRGDCSICGTSGPMRLNAGDYVQVYYNTSIADTILSFSFGGWRIK